MSLAISHHVFFLLIVGLALALLLKSKRSCVPGSSCTSECGQSADKDEENVWIVFSFIGALVFFVLFRKN